MSEYDLTPTVARYLDRHLNIPLLHHLTDVRLYPLADVRKAFVDVVAKTKMLDYAFTTHTQLVEQMQREAEITEDDDIPVFEIDDIEDKKQEIFREMEESKESVRLTMSQLEDPEVWKMLRLGERQMNFQKLKESINFNEHQLQNLFKFALVHYDTGDYKSAGQVLHHCTNFAYDFDMYLGSLWGQYAADILVGDYEVVQDDFFKLRDVIEEHTFDDNEELLRQRTWFLHWSLFLFFRHPKGKDYFLELVFQHPQYMNTIQTSSPWLLRYLSVAAVNAAKYRNSPKERNLVKDIAKIISQESYTYRDPVTELIESIYVSFDFDKAGAKLSECVDLLRNDFFLQPTAAHFLQNVRYHLFEAYAKIYSRIELGELFKLLGLTEVEGEKWVSSNVGRGFSLNVKIDLEKNVIIARNPHVTQSQYVIEKTKNIVQGGQQLLSLIEGRERLFSRRMMGTQSTYA